MSFDLLLKARFIISYMKMIPKTIKIRQLIREGDREKLYWYATKVGNQHAREAMKIFKVNLHIQGRENVPKEPVLYMGNHQSYFDPYTMLALRSERKETYIAKMEMTKIPFAEIIAGSFETLFLDRENSREGLKVILQAIEYIKEGNDVLIYPEGTRSKSHTMGEFHKGSFKVAQKTGCPIVPLVIDNTFKIFEATGKIRTGVDVYLTYLDPIYPDKLTADERKNIDDLVKVRIQNELDRLKSLHGYK